MRNAIEKKEDAGDNLIVQVLDLKEFTPEDMKKNMKARCQISDGVSKMIGMITEKAWT